ncbi:MAG: 3'-5' exonuclease [Bilophila sp.]
MTKQAAPVYIALDFETADYQPDSACAIGLAKIREKVVVDTFYSLVRPPRKQIVFTWVHGITWNQVKDSPTFPELWPRLSAFMAGATHLVAHNAPFDRRVLEACCRAAELALPELPFICTLKESRRLVKLPSHKLDALCTHFGITLQHHHAGADALAAAELWIRLQELEERKDTPNPSGDCPAATFYPR